MKILVVDDSSAMRLMVIRAIRQAGYEAKDIDQAEDGQIAFDKVKESVPDLILADWNMPNMTGMDLLQAMNEEEIKTTFGFITTESTKEMRQRASEAGAKFLIAKPFTPESFQKALNSVF